MISGWEWVVGMTGGNDDMFVLRGAVAALMQLMATPEWAMRLAEGQYLVEGFRATLQWLGG